MYLCPKECEKYYCAEVGSSDQYFRGLVYQGGYGFFGDLRRHITHLLYRVGRYFAKNLLETGKNVVSDVMEYASFKEAVRRRLGEASKNIQTDIIKKLQNGQGIKRKHRNKKHQTQVKRRTKKSRDIFD